MCADVRPKPEIQYFFESVTFTVRRGGVEGEDVKDIFNSIISDDIGDIERC